jgi:hypothetical protein
VAELGEDDLVLPEEGAPFRLTRSQETELPREVSVGYSDGGADYRRAVASSRRLVGGSASVAHADLAMVAEDSAVERRAEIWLQDSWAGRESAEFALPPSRLSLTPGDVVGLTLNGRRRLFEIREAIETERLAMRARSIDPEVFDLPLAQPVRRTPELPSAVGPVHALMLELPTLDASQPPVLMRVAVFADPWPGPVAIFRSSDGLSFQQTGLVLAPAIVGETLDNFPKGPTSRWSRHRVRVRLYGGALSSVSDSSLLAGANAAAVRGLDGTWEVLQFAQAELVAERTYELTRLIRGQAGSEWAISEDLPAGAPFVLLDEHVVAVARGLDALDREMQLRIVAAGRDHGDPTTVTLTATPGATALRPLRPVHLHARRTVAGVQFNWIRRARFDADSWTGEVPLGEANEAYALDIFDGADVVRTIEVASSAALYPAADEIADFGAPQASLHVPVAQLSATVGRGFAADAVLTPIT